MAKLVLDTNCLIQSIPQRSRYHVLWQSFVDGKNKLCVSNEILEEYIEILQRLTDNETAEYVVRLYMVFHCGTDYVIIIKNRKAGGLCLN